MRVPYVVRICIRHGKSEGRKEKNRVIKRDFPYSSFTASKAHENSPPPPLRSPQPPSLVRSPAVEAWTQTDGPRDGSQSPVAVAAQNRRDRKQIQSLKKCARQPAPATQILANLRRRFSGCRGVKRCGHPPLRPSLRLILRKESFVRVRCR